MRWKSESFFPRTIPLWNILPSSMVSSKTTEEFKGLIYITGQEGFHQLTSPLLYRLALMLVSVRSLCMEVD